MTGGPYYGARAYINVWNPMTYDAEFSIAQIWVISGPQDRVNTVEAGWLVSFYQILYYSPSWKYKRQLSLTIAFDFIVNLNVETIIETFGL